MPQEVMTKEDFEQIAQDLIYIKSMLKDLVESGELGAWKKSEVMAKLDITQTVMDNLIAKRLLNPFRYYEDGVWFIDKVEVLKLLPRAKRLLS